MSTRIIQPKIARRRFLRGTLGGVACAVGVPFLNLFLNANGDAVAATGAPLPRRFGTWFFGCGMNPQRWNPATVGGDWELTPELLPIARVRDRMNILSGFSVLLNGEATRFIVQGYSDRSAVGLRKKRRRSRDRASTY